jgi:hypothetical protein
VLHPRQLPVGGGNELLLEERLGPRSDRLLLGPHLSRDVELPSGFLDASRHLDAEAASVLVGEGLVPGA